ncbi:hypothetical protein CF336_g5868 [Tilletia laevis]|uniref:Uncharacterized protein n=1 Tax=Tilletia caries TaxID=13290 RepID=A0A177U316_9BASI|nr:hypothetical protein CF335_g6747 [Tilletia laevis]KAE8189133.1 hypothetical protein CF336_g5868 [Tilletia laevis]KAE8248680.1 hypothetical protein A4X03_0g6724 [Tilletia caries]
MDQPDETQEQETEVEQLEDEQAVGEAERLVQDTAEQEGALENVQEGTEVADEEQRQEGVNVGQGRRRTKERIAGKRRSPRLHDVQALSSTLCTEPIDQDWNRVELMGITEASELEAMALLANGGTEPRTLDGQLLEPATFAEALAREDRDEWKASMNDEYKSLIEMRTWELAHPPQGRKLIGCRWVYKVKTDPEGRAIRKKSRLVAQGFSQVEGSTTMKRSLR